MARLGIKPTRLWPTLAASAAVLCGFLVALQALTHGFEHWTFEALQGELRELAGSSADAVRLVSLSFDIEHDGQRELAEYASVHRADPRVWTIAAPASAQGSAALLTKLAVIVVPDGFGGYAHNGAIHLIDASGLLRAVYGYEQWQEALTAAVRLAGNAR